MGFRNVAAIVDAHESGRTRFCSFRKVPSQAGAAGWWVDLSMAAGNPVPNYYASAPLAAAVLEGRKGIFHGDDVAPATLHITDWGLMSPTAGFVGQFKLMDYVLYYPFIDGDDTDTQVMDNTVTLPRYTDGAGLQVMAVVVAPTTGGGSFTFTYINQDGVEKTSPVQGCASAAATITSLATSQEGVANMTGPYLRLAGADTGVRSIVSVQFTVPNGGLLALVLVKPLTDYSIREINTMAEVQFPVMLPYLPQVVDGAYLHMIMNQRGTVAAGILAGYCRFIWGTSE